MMKPEAQRRLDGMSWDWRSATCLLLDIARGDVDMPEKAALRIIRNNGLAVIANGHPVLTDAGLAYLRRVFA